MRRSKILWVCAFGIFLIAACAGLQQPKPESAKAYYNRGIVHYNNHRYDQAVSDFSRAVEMNPGYAKAYSNRGAVYDEIGRYEPALSDYSRAIELDEDNAEAYNNLAWLYATCRQAAIRNGAKAVENAQKAVELAPSIATFDTLAAAYAENGDFPNAVAAIQKAISLCNDPTLRQKLTDLQNAYRSHQTYVQYKHPE